MIFFLAKKIQISTQLINATKVEIIEIQQKLIPAANQLPQTRHDLEGDEMMILVETPKSAWSDRFPVEELYYEIWVPEVRTGLLLRHASMSRANKRTHISTQVFCQSAQFLCFFNVFVQPNTGTPQSQRTPQNLTFENLFTLEENFGAI